MKPGPKPGTKFGPRQPLEEQIFCQVQVDWSKPAEADDPKQESCWEWQGYVPTESGKLPYGRIKVNGDRIPRPVHRLVYEMFTGPIPDGLVIDHKCRNAKCCRPKHLRPLTVAENSDGGFVKQFRDATHCVNGHPFNEINTAPRRLHSKVIGRYCKVCRTFGHARALLLQKLGLAEPPTSPS